MNYYLHFTDEEIEVWKYEITFPKSYWKWVGEQERGLRPSGARISQPPQSTTIAWGWTRLLRSLSSTRCFILFSCRCIPLVIRNSLLQKTPLSFLTFIWNLPLYNLHLLIIVLLLEATNNKSTLKCQYFNYVRIVLAFIFHIFLFL